MGPAGRLASALTAKQACQSSGGATVGVVHGAVLALCDCAVAVMVVGVAEQHLAVQKPAAVLAAQTCAAAVVAAAVPAGPVVHAAPAVHGVPAGPAVHAGPGVQAYDAESLAAAAAVLAGSGGAPAAFAAEAKGGEACVAGQELAGGGSGFHRWGQWSCDTSLFRQEGSC